MLILSRRALFLPSLIELALQFDPKCFSYVLNFFRNASDTFYGTASTPGLFAAQQHLDNASQAEVNGLSVSQNNPLLTKQAIIVLREELEYFAIPPKDGKPSTDSTGIANDTLLDIKRQCGDVLLEKRNIFTALQRNVNKENNVAEQHLIDMLCMRSVFLVPFLNTHSHPVAHLSPTSIYCDCELLAADNVIPFSYTSPD